MTLRGEVIYIACPYVHEDKDIRYYRFKCATSWGAFLMKQTPQPIVYCPISQAHYMAEFGKLPGDYEFWKKQDSYFMQYCTTLHVLHLQGVEESIGVAEECKLAKQLGKMILDIPLNKILQVIEGKFAV